ncbi:uncharacterized protein LOC110729705 [Chenopodium quinoa]|uniref:uncharacterized protein LOC110729705 n=1 Tax=Chenopodium quinoa TaxID=63459 RepID=UPI000B788072|nr:uncharacterized protein LOC110729705 [Chenopodium quinoa]
MQEVIHIDEKWFYLNPETRKFYLLPKEEDPYRCQQLKRFKVKAMFIAMIGKPLYARDGTLLHDGKYGIFPLVKKQLAKKKSKNREAGTLETKPQNVPKNVKIQWDNARPHQIPKDEEFIADCHANGFNIEMVYRPALSPDLNVLDLGLFKVIQSLQYQAFPTTLDDLIKEVINAYNVFEAKANKYIWLTLQSVMIKECKKGTEGVLEKQGGNNFSPPHMKKKKLYRLGVLPKHLHVPRELIHQVVTYLDTMFIPTTHAADQRKKHTWK